MIFAKNKAEIISRPYFFHIRIFQFNYKSILIGFVVSITFTDSSIKQILNSISFCVVSDSGCALILDDSLNANGAEAYQAIVDGKVLSGTIITVDNKTHHNHLDLLFVKVGCQGNGVGQAFWKAIENLHPETKVWETCTPYFEKRNIHFYVNKCGFHIVEFYNPLHRDPNMPEVVGGMPVDVGDYFFRFEKRMQS